MSTESVEDDAVTAENIISVFKQNHSVEDTAVIQGVSEEEVLKILWDTDEGHECTATPRCNICRWNQKDFIMAHEELPHIPHGLMHDVEMKKVVAEWSPHLCSSNIYYVCHDCCDKKKCARRYNCYKLPTHSDMTEWLMKDYIFKTMRDTEEIYFYDNARGIYVNGGDRIIKEIINRRYPNCTNTFVNEVIGHITARTYIERKQCDPPNYICMKNGILKVGTAELIPHTPDIILLSQVPIFYDKDATCPRFEKFLTEVVESEDAVSLVEIMGYCLMPTNKYQTAFILVGRGANGKSVYMNVLRELIGKENTVSVMLQKLTSDKFAAATLYGKKANICSEISTKEIKYTGLFKALTGEDEIEGERKYHDSFQFKSNAKLIFCANKLPEVDDDTEAFWRRWRVIKFPNSFKGKENFNLFQELYEELGGIFNLALKAIVHLEVNNGFSNPQQAKNVMDEWKKRADSVYYFTMETLEKGDKDSRIFKEELYEIYVEFCGEKGITACEKGVFTNKLPRCIPVRLKRITTANKGRPWVWLGIKIKGSDEGIENTGETDDEQQQKLDDCF